MKTSTALRLKLSLAICRCMGNRGTFAFLCAALALLSLGRALAILDAYDSLPYCLDIASTVRMVLPACLMMAASMLAGIELFHYARRAILKMPVGPTFVDWAPAGAVSWAESTIEKTRAEAQAASDKAAIEKHLGRPAPCACAAQKRL